MKRIPKEGKDNKPLSNNPMGPQNVEALLNEVHALMALDHPHIVNLIEYFDEEEFLVFEHLKGPAHVMHMSCTCPIPCDQRSTR